MKLLLAKTSTPFKRYIVAFSVISLTHQYAEAFEIVPRMLAENAGLHATEVLSTLKAKHVGGNTNFGIPAEVRCLVTLLSMCLF